MVNDQKKVRVIDSIKKLIALGVLEKEIIGNLTDVGINIGEAKKLLFEAKNPTVQAPKTGREIPEKNLYDSSTKDLSIDDQISGQLNIKSSPKRTNSDDNYKPSQKDDSSQKSGGVSQNSGNGLKIKESTIKNSDDLSNENDKESDENEMIDSMVPGEDDSSDGQSETNDKKDDKKNTETNEINDEVDKRENIKKKFGLFGKKSDKDPIAELQKELNLTSESSEKEISKSQIDSQKINSQRTSPVASVDPVQKPALEKVVEKVASSVSNDELEQMWKKGIVTAINAKLSEMKKLKDDIDTEINAKVDAGVKKELKQFKVLLESQKALIISTNKEVLEDKQNEITLIIDSKISELKKQSAELSSGIEKVENAKKEQENSLQQIQTILADAKRTKAQLMIEMNSELIKAKSDAQVFIDSSEKHLQKLDEKVNKTLELEKNIADGLVAEAEQKIESMTIAKADDLIEKLEVKLNNLEAMQLKINPEKIDEKITLLDEFKKQFLQNIQENLTQINGAIKELNEKSEEADKLLQTKTLAIDAKIEELTKFEKSFTSKLKDLLEK